MITEDEIINNIELSDSNEKNDFFGFEAAKRKVYTIQEENRISNLEAKIKYAANRIFVNNGDSYHGKYIIQEISQVTLKNVNRIDTNNEPVENIKPNEKLQEQDVNNYKDLEKNQNVLVNQTMSTLNKILDNDIKEPDNNIKTVNKLKLGTDNQEVKSNKYDIVTTIKNKLHINNEKYEYLKHMKRLIIPKNKRLLLNEITKCAIVVYDISLDKDQIIEANTAIRKIIGEINFIKKNPKSIERKQSGIRVFILISTIQTWALTIKQKNEIPITQADYKQRICHPNFQTHYDMENYLLSLNAKYRGYFYGIVLAPGLVYGRGEKMLKYIYETAFSNTEQLLIPKDDNNLPIIHVDNLAKIVKNLVIYYDKLTTPYIVGVETSRFSLRNITEAIKEKVHKTNYEYCNYSSLFLYKNVTQMVYDMVTMSIQIIPTIDEYITKFMQLDEFIPRIFTETKELINEYLCKSSERKNIIINGPHETTNFAQKLAYTYNLKFIDPVTISEEYLKNLEISVDDIESLLLLNNFSNNQPTNQMSTKSTKIINNKTPLNSYNTETNNKYNENNLEKFSDIKLLEEQKKYFKDKGQISDEYLLPLLRNEILSSRENSCGYIIINFPKTIEQAKDLFDLEKLQSEKENSIHFLTDEIHPTIIIDIIMAGKNVKNNIMQNSPIKDSSSKLLIEDESDKIHDWFSLDSKYTQNEIINHILENDNIEIRKNRKVVDYLKVLFEPKIYKEYISINEDNFILIDQKEFDKLFDLLLINMPIKQKVIEAENEVSFIKSMINEMYNTHPTMITSTEKEDIDGKNLAGLLKETTTEDEHLVIKNIKIVDFVVKCVNPILTNGIMEIMKNMPEDPIDFLVEYIYNHNMYNPCASSPMNKMSKVADSLNKHLL